MINRDFFLIFPFSSQFVYYTFPLLLPPDPSSKRTLWTSSIIIYGDGDDDETTMIVIVTTAKMRMMMMRGRGRGKTALGEDENLVYTVALHVNGHLHP